MGEVSSMVAIMNMLLWEQNMQLKRFGFGKGRMRGVPIQAIFCLF